MLDSPLGGLILPVEVLGVHLQEDVYAVAGPLSHLGGWDAGIQPGR